MGKVYGYARVSSMEQNEERQMIALERIGVAAGNIYVDKQFGKDFHRGIMNRWRQGCKGATCSIY